MTFLLGHALRPTGLIDIGIENNVFKIQPDVLFPNAAVQMATVTVSVLGNEVRLPHVPANDSVPNALHSPLYDSFPLVRFLYGEDFFLAQQFDETYRKDAAILYPSVFRLRRKLELLISVPFHQAIILWCQIIRVRFIVIQGYPAGIYSSRSSVWPSCPPNLKTPESPSKSKVRNIMV